MRSLLMPIARDVVLPVLMAGAARGEPELLRWLVHANGDWPMRTDLTAPALQDESYQVGLLAVALVRNPDSPDLWRRVFAYELGVAEWGMHHLGEGILILPEHECRKSLQRARQVAERAPVGALYEADRAPLAELERALQEFEEWQVAGAPTSFPEWCSQRGLRHWWPTAVYYVP